MSEFPTIWWEAEEEAPVAPIRVHHRVTAVVVNRNGKPWLTETLLAVRHQVRPVDSLTIVDLSSDDGSEKLIKLESDALTLTLPKDAGISEAYAAAERASEESDLGVEWLWLLHDDSAPALRALGELLQAADENPNAAVIGGKIVDWHRPEHVLEVGTGLTPIGTRFTGLERGERDQGQHDNTKQVMAVNGAGMLVRREVWRALGGFSAVLAHFRTDSEFCLRVWESGAEVVVAPKAVMKHVAATARGMRRVEGHRGSSHFIDRYAGLLIALSRTPKRWLWLRWLLVLLAGGVRSLGYLLLQDVLGARDELSATAAALFSGGSVRDLRSAAGAGSVPTALRPTFRDQIGHLSTEFIETVSRGLRLAVDWLLPEREHVGDVGAWQAARAAMRRPGAVLTLLSVGAGLALAWPNFGSGQLNLPNGESVPADSAGLLEDYFGSWHAVGFGSVLAANPLQAIYAVVSLPFGGPLALFRLTMVLAIWMAAMSMHLSLRRLLRHAPSRVWLSALYGFSPPVLLAAARGDLSTVWAAVLLPPFAIVCTRLADSRRWVGLGAAMNGLLLAIWPALLFWEFLVAAIFAIRLRPTLSLALRWVFVLLWPMLLLWPWSTRVLVDPREWFIQFGVVSDSAASAAGALFGVGNPSFAPSWAWSVGLVAIAIAAAVDRRNRGSQQVFWLLLLAAMTVGFAAQLASDWLGFNVSLSVVSLICVALLIANASSAVNFVGVKLIRADFGWRQIVTLALVAVVSLAPIATFVNAITLSAPNRSFLSPPRTPEMLRGYTEDKRLRTLLLRSGSDVQIEADLLDGRVLQFGDRSAVDDSDRGSIASDVVAWITKASTDGLNPLQRWGVGYIAVPHADPLARRIAALGGLKRVITARSQELVNVWEVVDVSSRAYILEPDTAPALLEADTETRVPRIFGQLAADEKPRTLVLADRNAAGWVASLRGVALQQLPGDSLHWKVPANKFGAVEILRVDSGRLASLQFAGLAWGLILLLVAPRRPRSYEEEWLEEA